MRLVCSNPDCESNTYMSVPMFNIRILVDGDRDSTDFDGGAPTLNKTEPKHFLCWYCESEAVEGGE